MTVSTRKILSQTTRMVQARLLPLLAIWAAFMALVVFLTIPLVLAGGTGFLVAIAEAAASSQTGAIPANPFAAMGAAAIGIFVLAMLLLSVTFSAQYVALAAMSFPAARPGASDACMTGIRRIPTLAGITLALFFLYAVAGLIIAALGFALWQAAGMLALLILPLALAALAYLGCRIAVIFPLVAARSDATALSAIAGSWHLTRGHVLSIFLALLVVSLATIVLSLALELLPEGLAAILSLALFALMTVFQATMQATIFTLLDGHAAVLGRTFR